MANKEAVSRTQRTTTTPRKIFATAVNEEVRAATGKAIDANLSLARIVRQTWGEA
ncbi:hypothetical protein [Enemella evansiae]|uniref:hypothetical protein n=1 Tax=Enemella evansiae TaxID=2016499 RepID=UPI0015C686A6|nr:hypothetical protein [Enemella evansiae]